MGVTLYSTTQYTSAFSASPGMGLALARKFYVYKTTETRDYFFGRDVPSNGAGQEHLSHLHVAPSKNTEEWLNQFNKRFPNDYYRTSDRFLLYSQYKLVGKNPEYLLVDFFHDPGGHKRLREYIGDVHSNFANLRALPPGVTCLIEAEKKYA